ncbi:MAG: NAD-dependent protein deacylase [Actinomycetes bacterium]|nr:NAD-dependent protein deacylase [Actinomycetes bacterium]MDX5380367.1 NAD-dependent protein deacylase [Actinomycetes bacterium]MDX5399155.1 NAD-dependent protein deacylase [Actinomycetes bacterium]MDX5450100.1 NAD-dependent protein deacylase [Actinomycetes bacterium]
MSVERLREVITAAQNIVFFGGAGVSTESGIPDFRSADGLYAAQATYGAPPEDILSIDFLEARPDVFFDYYVHHILHLDAQPNAAHRALAHLEDEGRLSAVVTQNIDGLHQLAGSRTVHELHGSVRRNHCRDCGEAYDVAAIVAGAATPGGVPRCDRCGGVVRPGVVLYGEVLDDDVVAAAVHAIRAADVLIVGGTSLVVYPAAGLIHYFRGERLVLINRDPTPYDELAHLVIRAPIGQALGEAVLRE